MLKIKQLPVLNDNYIYLIVDKKTQITACVDPALAEPVIEYLNKENLSLNFILNTHHHFDHVGANLELKNMVVKLLEIKKTVTEYLELT